MTHTEEAECITAARVVLCAGTAAITCWMTLMMDRAALIMRRDGWSFGSVMSANGSYRQMMAVWGMTCAVWS